MVKIAKRITNVSLNIFDKDADYVKRETYESASLHKYIFYAQEKSFSKIKSDLSERHVCIDNIFEVNGAANKYEDTFIRFAVYFSRSHYFIIQSNLKAVQFLSKKMIVLKLERASPGNELSGHFSQDNKNCSRRY